MAQLPVEPEDEIAAVVQASKVNETGITSAKSKDVSKKSKEATLGGVAGGLAVYGIDLGVDLAAGYAAATLGTEAMLAVSAATGGLAVGAAALAIYKIYKWHQSSMTEEEIKLQKQYNNKVMMYNDAKIQLENEFNRYKVSQQHIDIETERINTKFNYDRENSNSKVIVAIGETGNGKSLFCNRMLGDDREISDIAGVSEEDDSNGTFAVADEFDIDAQTDELQIERKNIKLNEITKDESKNNKNGRDLQLTIVDTPGALDTENKDDAYSNVLSKYFRGCGGINMFCIFFKLGSKFTSAMQTILKSYQSFYGKQFWQHCVIIITKCDESKRGKTAQSIEKFDKKLNKLKATYIKNFNEKVYNSDSKDGNDETLDLEMIQFGDNNFVESRKRILFLLTDPSSKFYTKYQCQNISSPMDELKKVQKDSLDKMTNQAKIIRDLMTQLDTSAAILKIDTKTGKKKK